MHDSLKKQHGFFNLIELSIALGIALSIWGVWAMVSKYQQEYEKAAMAGNQLAEYVSKVRAFTSRNQYSGGLLSDYLINNGMTTQATGLVLTGTNWLKMNNTAPSPGQVGCVNGLQGTGDFTDANPFLNCNFNDRTKFNQTYQTTIWWSVSPSPTFPGDGVIRTRTVLPPVDLGEGVRMDITSRIINRAAASTYGSATSDVTSADFEIDQATNEIVVLTDFTNASSVWLEIQGTNEMTGPINAGGNTLRDANRGHFSSNLRIGGTVGNFDTDNDADNFSAELEVVGDALISNNTNIGGDAIVGNDLSVSNEATIESQLTVISGNIMAEAGDIAAEAGNISVGKRLLLSDNSGATGNVGIDGLVPNELYIDFPNEANNRGLLAVEGDIYTTDIDRYSSQALYDISIVENGAAIDKPSCPVGKTPQIFVAVASVGRAVSDAYPLAGISTYAIDNGDDTWSVYLQILDEEGVHGGETGSPLTFPRNAIFVSAKCT